MPVRHARSGTRGLPPFGRRGGIGRNGSTRSHNGSGSSAGHACSRYRAATGYALIGKGASEVLICALSTIPANVFFVPMDFTKDSLLEQLVKVGYSEQQKAFFGEGVVVYLPAVKDTLDFVCDHAAPGSRIAFDYILSRNGNVNNPQNQWAR